MMLFIMAIMVLVSQTQIFARTTNIKSHTEKLEIHRGTLTKEDNMPVEIKISRTNPQEKTTHVLMNGEAVPVTTFNLYRNGKKEVITPEGTFHLPPSSFYSISEDSEATFTHPVIKDGEPQIEDEEIKDYHVDICVEEK